MQSNIFINWGVHWKLSSIAACAYGQAPDAADRLRSIAGFNMIL